MGGQPVSVRMSCRESANGLSISAGWPRYDEAGQVCRLHATLGDINSDYRHGVSDALLLVNINEVLQVDLIML